MINGLLNAPDLQEEENSTEVVLTDVRSSRPNAVTLDLVHSFVALKRLNDHGVIFALTSSKPGEGVTHVTHTLGVQLAEQTGEDVLIIHASTLGMLSPAALERGNLPFVQSGGGVWINLADQRNPQALASSRIDKAIWNVLRKRFAYVLLDCRSLYGSTEVATIGSDVDATILVVAAGKTEKHTLQQASRVLSVAGIHLAGCILNKRTYPVPRFIYKFL